MVLVVPQQVVPDATGGHQLYLLVLVVAVVELILQTRFWRLALVVTQDGLQQPLAAVVLPDQHPPGEMARLVTAPSAVRAVVAVRAIHQARATQAATVDSPEAAAAVVVVAHPLAARAAMARLAA